jgi:RNA polymerase sigma factor (sigma-70 family)
MVALRDEDLVERAAGGDVDAFEALVAPRLNRAFRTASAILGSEADAYDVVQEASVATWRHLPKLRDRTRFDAWLHKMIVKRSRDALRRRRRSRGRPRWRHGPSERGLDGRGCRHGKPSGSRTPSGRKGHGNHSPTNLVRRHPHDTPIRRGETNSQLAPAAATAAVSSAACEYAGNAS